MKILFIIIILFQTSCSTIEVAKEVSKASRSVRQSVDNLINPIEEDKKKIEVERKKEIKIVMEQKKVFEVNFLEKNLSDIKVMWGKPDLYRKDGNSNIARFDTDFCKLFLFFNSKNLNGKVKYFELRDVNGNLIIKKNEVQNCYKALSLS